MNEISAKLNPVATWKDENFQEDELSNLELKNPQTNTTIPILVIGNKLDSVKVSRSQQSKSNLEETEGGNSAVQVVSFQRFTIEI